MTALTKYEDNQKSELEYAREFAKLIVGSGKWNKDWNQDTVALLAIYAKSIGIHPIQAAMNGFEIIEGKIQMKPIQMSGMIRKNGHSIKIVETNETKCVLEGTRRDNGDKLRVEFNIDDAKRAGLFGKKNWASYPTDMFYSKAMGRLGRMLFADIIGGAYCEGELDERESRPAQKYEQLEPPAITVEPIDMETGEFKPEHTLEELHIECGIGTIEDVKNFVRYIAIAKKDSGWDEQKVLDSMLENDKALSDFKEKLAKRIEKSYTVETKPEV